MPKKYRLLTSFLKFKEGDVLTRENADKMYWNSDGHHWYERVHKLTIKSHPEIFEEIKEQTKYPPYLHDLMKMPQDERENWVHDFNKIKDFDFSKLAPKGETKVYSSQPISRNLHEHTDIKPLSGELITKEECERRGKEVFKKARLHHPFAGFKYEDYEDYQQSLK